MNFIIPILVGAIIGYFTNWLAIKMLFRPHYEKRIFGIRLPFTPGLIPKEKSRIAKSVGEAVGDYLLSPEIISETILSENTSSYIKNWIYEKMIKIKEEERTIGFYLDRTFKGKFGSIKKSIDSLVLNLSLDKIKKEENIDAISGNIVKLLLEEENLNKLDSIVREELKNSLESKELKREIEKFYNDSLENILRSDLRINDILPNDLFVSLDLYLTTNKDKIGNSLRRMLGTGEIRLKLRSTISNLVENNVSRLITSFVSVETITDKILSAIDKYINDKKSEEDFLMILRKVVDSLKEKEISLLGSFIRDNLEEERFAEIVLSYLGREENIDRLSSGIDKKIRSINKYELKLTIKNKLKALLDEKTLGDLLIDEISSITNNLLNIKVSYLIDKIESRFDYLYGLLKNYMLVFVEKDLITIIKSFNISKIVEDNINSFDLDFSEKLILDIAAKELKAITWLGALLGAIMGIISPLLQMI